MKLVALTWHTPLPGEEDAIQALFDAGLETLHLRKPGYSAGELCELVEGIDHGWHRKIVLHDRFELLDEYELKGVHLNSRNPESPYKEGISISKSCHSLAELKNIDAYDYVFLSPVFDSISKSGYSAAFAPGELTDARDKGLINEKIYALGGVSAENIGAAAKWGFGGVAVLGALWSDFSLTGDMETLLTEFRRLKSVCDKF